jgi:NDP-sugar pyrophosphorylase family protein
MHQAFILGAGLGTRLRPLTDRLPKPLVPLFHQPIAAWTINACAKLGIRRFAINTHHLPTAWDDFAAQIGEYDITFFHEPVLLETGGGLRNIAEWVDESPLLVHNGDIFTTMPLDALIAAHKASGLPVTLALRSHGTARHIALNAEGNRVIDIHEKLARAPGTHVFSGIYCVNPEFIRQIPAHEKISVIPFFLDLAKKTQLGAVTLDEGMWLDLGDRESYLRAHRELDLAPRAHPSALIHPGATVVNSVIGPGAVVESGALVRDSVVWPNAKVSSDADLNRCIVCSSDPIHGTHRDADL